MALKAPKNVSEILLRRKLAEPAVLAEAEETAREANMPLEKVLTENQTVSPDNMTLVMAEYLGLAPVSLLRFTPEETLLKSIPPEILQRHRIMPVARFGKTLTVAMGDPFNIMAMEELHSATGLNIVPLVAKESDVIETIKRAYANEEQHIDMEDVMQDQDAEMEYGTVEEKDDQNLEDMMKDAEDQPIIRMVNTILIEAVRMRTNDIHIDAQENYVRLRYRIDGQLVERPKLPGTLRSAIISRIKILADMDIGEQRIPQDGRFRINTLNKMMDVRVNITPTIHGGRIVMRLLDKNALFPDLAALDLDRQAYKIFSHAISQPHGIILVTGPTGSGKTTTLYSCLQELNKIDVNIVTCEEPVEYQIPGIIQSRITPTGCTFAAALRAILRQDPDIVLIGELRDTETAEIAIKAALTGHLVLSTLHANDAPSTIPRLLDMGIEPFLLASSIILTQSQRLFRKLCPSCKKPATPDPDLLALHKIDPNEFDGSAVYDAVGCIKCQKIGYRGRASIMEVLPIDDDIRLSIMQNEPSDSIRDKAIKNGMIPISKAVLNKVKDGTTSLDAAVRIISSR